MLKSLILLLLACGIVGAVDLGVIDVTANTQKEEAAENSFSDVFAEPEYLQSSEHIEAMPSQKRITTKEAMFIPGVQGDPIKAMQSLSGVTSMGDTTGELFIYGSKPEESLTTINHLPIGYLFHMGGLHSVIAPEAVEQIDAYMAGFDVTYGNAMGGVINVTPKYPNDELSGYGHLGIYDSSAGINVPINDDISFFLGARRSYFDLLLGAMGKATGTLDADTNTTYTELPNYYDITFLMKYQPDSNNLYSLELISAGDSLNIASEKNKVKDPKAIGKIQAKYGFTTIGARHQGFYNNYTSNTLLYNKNSSQQVELFTNYYLDLQSSETGLYHQSTLDFDRHKIVAGAELSNFYMPMEMNITRIPSPDKPDYDFTTQQAYYIKEDINVNSLALFLEDIYSISDALKLRVGGRFSYSDYLNLQSNIDPRVSLLYALDNQNNLSFASGIYTQLPSGYKTIKDIGNPNSTYEKAYHYVAHYDTTALEHITFNIDGYYKKYLSLLVEDATNNFENAGNGYAYGVDTNLKYRNDNYYAFLSYTFLNSKRNLNTANDTLYRFYGEIPHTVQCITGVKFWDNWAFSTRLNYHSGAPYTDVVGTYAETGTGRTRPIYGELFGSRLPNYFSLNLKIAQEVKFANNSSLEWSFEIMNVTNNENVSSIKYDDNYNKEGYVKQLPLLPWFDLTYRF